MSPLATVPQLLAATGLMDAKPRPVPPLAVPDRGMPAGSGGETFLMKKKKKKKRCGARLQVAALTWRFVNVMLEGKKEKTGPRGDEMSSIVMTTASQLHLIKPKTWPEQCCNSRNVYAATGGRKSERDFSRLSPNFKKRNNDYSHYGFICRFFSQIIA